MAVSSDTGNPRAVAPGATALLVGTLAAAYLVSQFLRNSIGVIAPDLATEIGLSAAQIGILSSAFFLAFALAQIPLGICLDRYGPKRCMLVCAAIVVVGVAMFALAATSAGLIAARVLMGLGTSCYLMAPLALYAKRYPPERFAVMAGLQMAIGTIGTLLATAPLGFAAAAIGWRGTFLWVTGVMALAGLLIAVAVKDDAVGSEAGTDSLRDSIMGVRRAIRMPSVVLLFLMQMATYSSFVLIVGLWGGPYLSHIYGYSLTARGEYLLVPAIAQTIGLMLWGSTVRIFGSHKLPVLAGTLATAALLGYLAAVGTLTPMGLVVWLAVFGLVSAYIPVLIAHGKALFPHDLIGRGMTVLNMGTMGGVFVSQTVTGFAIDLFPTEAGAYPLAAYRLAFALQAVFVVAASVSYVFARDPLQGPGRAAA